MIYLFSDPIQVYMFHFRNHIYKYNIYKYNKLSYQLIKMQDV